VPKLHTRDRLTGTPFRTNVTFARLECPNFPFVVAQPGSGFRANVTFVRLECPNVTFVRAVHTNVTFGWIVFG